MLPNNRINMIQSLLFSSSGLAKTASFRSPPSLPTCSGTTTAPPWEQQRVMDWSPALKVRILPPRRQQPQRHQQA